jgi:hypothetical protein
MEPPAYFIHAWNAQSGVVTHTAYVGDFAGPYSFEMNSAPAAK